MVEAWSDEVDYEVRMLCSTNRISKDEMDWATSL